MTTTRALATQIEAFLRFKRSIGCKYVRAEFWLKAFCRFAQRDSGRTARLEDLARTWLARDGRRKAVSVAYELCVLRQFFLYLKRSDPAVVVPDSSFARRSTSEFLPHILDAKDIKSLLRGAERLRFPITRAVYRALLLVLYCAGLRFGEAVRLRLADLDRRRGALWIAESKGRARWVPFHASLAQELVHYLAVRRLHSTAASSDALFLSSGGQPLRVKTASQVVRILLRRAHLKPSSGRVGPRPYDIRHAFAVHRLVRWYHAGVDVHTRLPWLSAYMGHDDILGTEVYLTATPQLLHLAARRLRGRLMARRRWA